MAARLPGSPIFNKKEKIKPDVAGIKYHQQYEIKSSIRRLHISPKLRREKISDHLTYKSNDRLSFTYYARAASSMRS